MEDVVLRPLTEDDLPRVEEIENDSFTVPWSMRTFRQLLARDDADAAGAECDGLLVGYSVFWSVLDQAELGDIAVDADFRGRGIGSMLLRDTFRRAAARGIRRLFLEVRVSNVDAHRLYERHGFTSVGRRRRYYRRPVEDALVMLKHLDDDGESAE